MHSIGRRRWLQLVAAGLGTGVSGTATGRLQERTEPTWSTELDGNLAASPTVVDGTVFVGGGSYLYAIDAASGEVLWSTDHVLGIRGSAAVWEGMVFVTLFQNTVVALDAATGETQWEFDGSEEYLTLPSLPPSPQVRDGTVYVGRPDGTFYALDANSGDVEWTYEWDGAFQASPVLEEGRLYAASKDGTIHAIDPSSGERQWRASIGELSVSSPTVTDGRLYIGDAAGTLYAIDTSNGDVRLQTDTGAEIKTTPTVADGRVFVGNWAREDAFSAYDAESGEELWTYGFSGMTTSSPTVVGDRVYAGNSDVIGFDAATGERLVRFHTEAGMDSSPTVVDGTLYVGDDDDTLYAFDTEADATSDGSRIRNGTLGHTDSLPGATVGGDIVTETGGSGTGDDDEDSGPTDGGDDTSGDDAPGGSDADGGNDTGDDGSSGDGTPGPGVLGGVTALVAGSAALARRSGGDDPDSE